MSEARSFAPRTFAMAAPLGVAQILRSAAAAVCQAVVLRWRIQHDRIRLLEMDDRMLEDVGLTRHKLHLHLRGRLPESEWR